MKRRTFLLSGAAAVAAPVAGWACPTSNPCVAVPQPGHVTQGNLRQALTHWVWVCHPDYSKLLQPRWWSYVPTSTNGWQQLVEQVLRNPRNALANEVEVQGQECRQQWFTPGWRILTVTNCRRVDKRWIFLLTRPLTAADYGRALGPSDWEELPYVFDI